MKKRKLRPIDFQETRKRSRAQLAADSEMRAELAFVLPDEMMRLLDSTCEKLGMRISDFVETVINAPGASADQLGFHSGLPANIITWVWSRARMLSQH
jgi:hypothetical protein